MQRWGQLRYLRALQGKPSPRHGGPALGGGGRKVTLHPEGYFTATVGHRHLCPHTYIPSLPTHAASSTQLSPPPRPGVHIGCGDQKFSATGPPHLLLKTGGSRGPRAPSSTGLCVPPMCFPSTAHPFPHLSFYFHQVSFSCEMAPDISCQSGLWWKMGGRLTTSQVILQAQPQEVVW